VLQTRAKLYKLLRNLLTVSQVVGEGPNRDSTSALRKPFRLTGNMRALDTLKQSNSGLLRALVAIERWRMRLRVQWKETEEETTVEIQ